MIRENTTHSQNSLLPNDTTIKSAGAAVTAKKPMKNLLNSESRNKSKSLTKSAKMQLSANSLETSRNKTTII